MLGLAVVFTIIRLFSCEFLFLFFLFLLFVSSYFANLIYSKNVSKWNFRLGQTEIHATHCCTLVSRFWGRKKILSNHARTHCGAFEAYNSAVVFEKESSNFLVFIKWFRFCGWLWKLYVINLFVGRDFILTRFDLHTCTTASAFTHNEHSFFRDEILNEETFISWMIQMVINKVKQ